MDLFTLNQSKFTDKKLVKYSYYYFLTRTPIRYIFILASKIAVAIACVERLTECLLYNARAHTSKRCPNVIHGVFKILRLYIMNHIVNLNKLY